jgi:large subunit ribosomal protein L28
MARPVLPPALAALLNNSIISRSAYCSPQVTEDEAMPRVCEFTGRKTSTGRSLRYRGKAKYLGGVGKKVTGRTKRRFRPNIQNVTAMVDGRRVRVKASAKAIRMGLIVKPLKRRFAYTAKQAQGTQG